MTEVRAAGWLSGRLFGALCALFFAAWCGVSAAQTNAIESVTSATSGTTTVLRIQMKAPPAAQPGGFSINNPPRIALDFPNTDNKAGQSSVDLPQGDVRNVAIVAAGGRARVVLNLKRPLTYTTSIEGNTVLVSLTPVAIEGTNSAAAATSFSAIRTESNATFALRDIDFRRGRDGEGRVVIDLSGPGVGVDIRQQGQALIVDFLKSRLPENLRKRLDVADFGTPIKVVRATQVGDNARLVIEPQGTWEHNAYQSENQFVVEVKPVREDPNKLGGRQGYRGDRLSLNFQNVDVRALLQVIADFTNLNIVTSDSVAGSLTLRLKDVPWDQALDIVLQSKALDMRKSGNVILIAPREELEMGNPLVGLESSRVRRKLGFEEALALAREEKARPTLRSIHATLVENLREIYSNLGYVLPEEGLPYRGEFAKGDIAVLSMVPADVEDERSDHITRLLCYRPIAMGSLMKQMAEKKIVVVIEPRPTPGSLPAFFTEIRTTMPPEFKGQVISITCPANMTILYSKHLDHIDEIVAKIKKSPKKALPVYDLALDDTAE